MWTQVRDSHGSFHSILRNSPCHAFRGSLCTANPNFTPQIPKHHPSSAQHLFLSSHGAFVGEAVRYTLELATTRELQNTSGPCSRGLVISKPHIPSKPSHFLKLSDEDQKQCARDRRKVLGVEPAIKHGTFDEHAHCLQKGLLRGAICESCYLFRCL